MPTARELLEQADALMRRNRQDAVQGVRTTPARGTTVPFTIGAEAGERLAPAPARSTVPPATTAVSDIPVLDEVVVAAPPPADDEFPVLTDAIDEIDVAMPAPIDGEPSDWLLASSEDQSVLGPSPPSVALVPSVEPRAPAAPELGSMRREHSVPPVPASTVAASAHRQPAETRVALPPPALEDFDLDAPAGDEPPITVVRTPGASPGASVVPAAPASWLEELVAEVPALPVPASVPPAQPSVPVPIDAAPIAAASIEAGPIEAEPALSHHESSPVPFVGAQEAAASEVGPKAIASVAPASPPRDESWEALAEEIRMQVLQRIDLFTDTGLRERLGERLKPIVDRASADLVATINQHVGELLRAYVAEAIEREIERWRAGR